MSRAQPSIGAVVIALWSIVAPSSAAGRYSAQRAGDVVQLHDIATATSVSIIPTLGNMAFELSVKGQNLLRWPFASIDEFKARPGASGIPFLAPWANRLDEPAFYANGKRYPFDLTLGNVRGALPIHGFLQTTNLWQVVEIKSTDRAAWVTSRLEFFRQPAWMKQWPFAHTIEMTHTLQNGVLEVRTRLINLSAEPMPVAIGFHPYFRLTDVPRDEWTIAIGARTHWLLTPTKVPTGETEPIERRIAAPGRAPLKDYDLDDVFGDLMRDVAGLATMSVTGRSQRLEVVLGPNYRAVVVFSPRDRDFICFEPMAGITNALNLAQQGKYGELQLVPPGSTWQERFWVKPKGL